MNAPLAVVVAFGAGLIAGWLWREAWELITERETVKRFLVRVRSVNFLAWALVIVLIFNAIVGATVVVNNSQRADLVRCLTSYNQLSGAARDERNAAASVVGDAQLDYVRADLRYQRGLLKTLRDDDASLADLANVINSRADATDAFLATLVKQQRVRATTDYPPPDLCEAP